uniref:Homeobox domain-containing protein n=1 Tax=Sciurus vulgaris TaxID=55149 RepID=A0A8D2AL03_SCIVU
TLILRRKSQYPLGPSRGIGEEIKKKVRKAQWGRRHDRTKFTKEQLKILMDTFNQMPYPGHATKQRLAVEVNAEESRIQVWFQNRRARHKFQERTLESSQGPGQDRTRERMQSEARGAAPPTAALSCTPSSGPSGTTPTLGSSAEKSLPRRSAFPSPESRFGFKIEDLDYKEPTQARGRSWAWCPATGISGPPEGPQSLVRGLEMH